MEQFNIILFILGGFFVLVSSIKPNSNSKKINISEFSSESFKD